MENEGRAENEKIARAINSYLDENYYGLSRGFFQSIKKMEMAFIIKIYRKMRC